MFKVEIKGLKDLQADVDYLIKSRIPKMTAMALTETAKKLKEATPAKLQEVFDRPTRWTLGGIYYQPASVNNLNAYVWFKDDLGVSTGTPAAKYLAPEVYGGSRNLKRFERALKYAGLLPDGYYAVPGAGVRLDAYGNIPGPMIVKILSAAKAAETQAGYTMNQTARSRKRNTRAFDVFVGRPGVKASPMVRAGDIKRLGGISALIQAAERYKAGASGSRYPLGIWERTSGHGLIPLIIFVKAPHYKVRFPFFDWAQEFVDRELPVIFKRIADETLAYHKAKG